MFRICELYFLILDELSGASFVLIFGRIIGARDPGKSLIIPFIVIFDSLQMNTFASDTNVIKSFNTKNIFKRPGILRRGRTVQVSPHSSSSPERSVSPERFYPKLKKVSPEWLTEQLKKKPLKSCLAAPSVRLPPRASYLHWVEHIAHVYGQEFADEVDADMSIAEIAALIKRREEKLLALNST